MSSVVTRKFIWERGQAKHLMFSGYQTKDMLFWERGSGILLTGKDGFGHHTESYGSDITGENP